MSAPAFPTTATHRPSGSACDRGDGRIVGGGLGWVLEAERRSAGWERAGAPRPATPRLLVALLTSITRTAGRLPRAGAYARRRLAGSGLRGAPDGQRRTV